MWFWIHHECCQSKTNKLPSNGTICLDMSVGHNVLCIFTCIITNNKLNYGHTLTSVEYEEIACFFWWYEIHITLYVLWSNEWFNTYVLNAVLPFWYIFIMIVSHSNTRYAVSISFLFELKILSTLCVTY